VTDITAVSEEVVSDGAKAVVLGKHQHTDNGTDDVDMAAEVPPKKKKKKSSGGDVSKNALQALNELMPGLKYNCISQTGPVHQPTFTVQVVVNDQVHHFHHLHSLLFQII